MCAAEAKTLLTVPEAAKALRIGRSTAYDLAHAWLDSGGTKGLPVVAIGGSLRVPVAAIERLFAIGGFGPAWQSGLDRRRASHCAVQEADADDDARASSGAERAADAPVPAGVSDASERTVAADPPPVTATASEPRTRAPSRPRRLQRDSGAQLSLFDAPDP